jgi:hypothetical protein
MIFSEAVLMHEGLIKRESLFVLRSSNPIQFLVCKGEHIEKEHPEKAP